MPAIALAASPLRTISVPTRRPQDQDTIHSRGGSALNIDFVVEKKLARGGRVQAFRTFPQGCRNVDVAVCGSCHSMRTGFAVRDRDRSGISGSVMGTMPVDVDGCAGKRRIHRIGFNLQSGWGIPTDREFPHADDESPAWAGRNSADAGTAAWKAIFLAQWTKSWEMFPSGAEK